MRDGRYHGKHECNDGKASRAVEGRVDALRENMKDVLGRSWQTRDETRGTISPSIGAVVFAHDDVVANDRLQGLMKGVAGQKDHKEMIRWYLQTFK